MNIMDGDVSDWKEGMALGFIILCLCLGIGGCCYLLQLGSAKEKEASRSIIITNSFNTLEHATTNR